MKLRAPRCNDAASATELWAFQCSQSTGLFSSAGACGVWASATATGAVSSAVRTTMCLIMMERHSVRHRLHRIPFSEPPHEDKECKIGHRKDPRQRDGDALRRLHPQIHEREKRDGEHPEEQLVDPAAIANRLDRRPIQPRQEEV